MQTQPDDTAWSDWKELLFFVNFLEREGSITHGTAEHMRDRIMTFKGYAMDCSDFFEKQRWQDGKEDTTP